MAVVHQAVSLPKSRLGLAVAILAGLTLVRVIGLATSVVDLFPDEAQYWAWSRDLAWGYFSKPPLLAWTIAAADHVCGSAEACIRAPAPILYFATSLVVYAIAATLYADRARHRRSILGPHHLHRRPAVVVLGAGSARVREAPGAAEAVVERRARTGARARALGQIRHDLFPARCGPGSAVRGGRAQVADEVRALDCACDRRRRSRPEPLVEPAQRPGHARAHARRGERRAESRPASQERARISGGAVRGDRADRVRRTDRLPRAAALQVAGAAGSAHARLRDPAAGADHGDGALHQGLCELGGDIRGLGDRARRRGAHPPRELGVAAHQHRAGCDRAIRVSGRRRIRHENLAVVPARRTARSLSPHAGLAGLRRGSRPAGAKNRRCDHRGR